MLREELFSILLIKLLVLEKKEPSEKDQHGRDRIFISRVRATSFLSEISHYAQADLLVVAEIESGDAYLGEVFGECWRRDWN